MKKITSTILITFAIIGIISLFIFAKDYLKEIIEEGMFQFELQFENEGDEFNITLFTIEPDDYYAKIKKGVYIDHLHSLLFKKEKKLLKKLLKIMNSY